MTHRYITLAPARAILTIALLTVAILTVVCAVAVLGLAAAHAGESGAGRAPPADNQGSALEPPAGPQDRAKSLDELFGRLAKASTESEAAQIKGQIREIWNTTGSPTVDLLLARDAQAAMAHDLGLRRRLLEAITHLAPDSPEAWNRRADLDYAQQHAGDAIADLGHVLAVEPRQFDALESMATLLKETGRNGLALKAFRQLLTIDPTSATIKSEIDDLARKVEGLKI